MLQMVNSPWKKQRLSVLLAALAVAGIWSAFIGSNSDQPEFATVQRGDIVRAYVAQGRVECDVMIDIIPEITARIDKVYVKEGDEIEPGQVLVTLEDNLLQAAHSEADYAAKAAKAKWDELKAGTRAEEIEQAKAQVRELQAGVETAEARLAEIKRGARPEEIDNAQQLLKAALADEDYAEKEKQRAEKLKEDRPETELDSAYHGYALALALRQSREAQLRLLQNGATEEVRRQAAAAVMAAKSRQAGAEAQLDLLEAGATKEQLLAMEAAYHQAEANETRAKAMLDNTRIVSPIKGYVLRRYRDDQELVHPQMPDPILVICDRKPRSMRVEVVEGDVYKVRVGQPAWITSEGFIGRRWHGTVTRIASVMGRKLLASENPKEKTDVRVLEAWITPDEPLDLPVNLPVEVTVSDTVRSDVPVLPARAIVDDDQIVMADHSRRQVQLGQRDDGFVEIVSGVALGERVSLP